MSYSFVMFCLIRQSYRNLYSEIINTFVNGIIHFLWIFHLLCFRRLYDQRAIYSSEEAK